LFFFTFSQLSSKLAIAQSPYSHFVALKNFSQKDAHCRYELSLSGHIASVVGVLALISTWSKQPNLYLQPLIETLGFYRIAFSKRSPWPHIHEQAKLARVPIMMYHDILPTKEVFFDVTPSELEAHFQLMRAKDVTPISLNLLMIHLQTGLRLPEKPILLTFDDGYGGHYEYVYPLLKKYNYPAVFSIYTKGVGNNSGRTHVNWEQLREMAADSLVTIASHSISHPHDLTKLSDEQLLKEVKLSKRILEAQLGLNIKYFTYPVGKYDDRVAREVATVGYQLAFTMSDQDERFAGASHSLLAVSRFGQSRLKNAIAQAWGGQQLTPCQKNNLTN
jgi:peptidoglycan/xylan/chitin deacetylase (PgdA/CDA1 family)